MFRKNVRFASAAALITMTYCAFSFLVTERAFASANHIERPEEELLILELHVNGYKRNKGLLGYLPQGKELNHALFPLSSLSRALSFAIKSNPSEGIAEGWFKEEKNVFQLDLNRQIIFVNGGETNLPRGGAEAHFEDIYVRLNLLEKWFNIQMKPDISTLRLYITKETAFPFEEEYARKERDEYQKTNRDENIKYNPNIMLPYQWVSKPSIVWQHSAQGNKNSDDSTLDTSFSLQSKMDILKFGTNLSIAGAAGTDNNPEISNVQMTFQRRDPGNKLFGPLKAGRVSFGDVDYPDVPLLTGRKRGRGIAISSNSNIDIAQSFGAEQYDVDGDGPIGWDAELYRNGYFIGFQEIGDNGRYNFEEIELIRGFNLFQIILYGPEGQKRTETQRIIRGQKMLHKGEMNYDFTIGQPDSAFLPITDNSPNDSSFGGSGSIFYGIKNSLTVGGSVFTGSDQNNDNIDKVSAASVSAVTAFLGLRTQVQLMKANEGRSAYSADTTTQILKTNVTVGHTNYDGFTEDDKELLSTTSIDANRNFGKFSTSLSAEQSKYQDREDELTLRNNFSTNISRVRLTNSLERTLSDNNAQKRFDGDISLLTNIKDWRVRATLQYDLDNRANETLQDINFSALKKISRKSRLRLNGSYDFPTNVTNTDLRYTKEFDTYSLDLNTGTSTDNNHFVGVTFRTGFQSDHNGNYKMVGSKNGGMGSVGLRAYLDENGNKVFDKGERTLQNVAFRSNRGVIDGFTDETGSMFVNGLPDGLTRFELNETSLPSIYIKPYDDIINIIPRGGATTKIDVGFEQLGEIDGFVYTHQANGEKKEVPGLEVILIDASTNEEVSAITSEYDGYFIFSALPLGQYIIKALPFWDEGNDTIPTARANLTHENSIITDLNITLPAIQEISQAKPEDVNNIQPALGTTHPATVKAAHIIDDAHHPVITDGLDIATREPLRGLFIHIGSEQSFKAAQEEQKRLWALYKDIIGDISLYIYKIEIGGKGYHRIVGLVDSYTQGNRTCDALLDAKSIGGCVLSEM